VLLSDRGTEKSWRVVGEPRRVISGALCEAGRASQLKKDRRSIVNVKRMDGREVDMLMCGRDNGMDAGEEECLAGRGKIRISIVLRRYSVVKLDPFAF